MRCSPHHVSGTATRPPISARSTASVINCRTIRPRPAPIAVRIAISRDRPAARVSSRLATLAQAMSSTNVTAPIMVDVTSATSAGMKSSRNACAEPTSGSVGSPYCTLMRREMAATSASACAAVAPGLSRAIIATPRTLRGAVPRSGVIGIQISATSGNLNRAGMMPVTV